MSAATSPCSSPGSALVTRTAWCQQWAPEIGSGWTGNVAFWWTADVGPPDPGGVGVGRLVGAVGLPVLQRPPAAVANEVHRRGLHALCRGVPALGLLGRLPPAHVVAAGDHAGADRLGDPGLDHEVAAVVVTRTRSPVAMSRSRACEGWIHRGLVWASSLSHLALALRVWICTGSRDGGATTTY